MHIKSFFRLCINAFYPSRCPYCNSVIAKNKIACEKCISKVQQENITTQLMHTKSISPFRYDGMYKKAIQQLKFNNYGNYAEQMAMVMSNAVKKEYANCFNDNNNFDFITCVPFTKNKYKERGYNQSKLLAQNISYYLKIEYRDILIKTKDNKTQHTLTRKQRIENVHNVFDINSKYSVRNKKILVIDDILTTGSTLDECANVLLNNGAKEVLCATFTTTIVNNTKATQN
ncbi:MAG: phosphoribosyltransferase family protein [Acutalibacteraceae bacterium]|nr:phosphoribosyltransferase family protein [Acutalibacteraceae bacterium]